MIVFIGDRPSMKNLDTNVPFVGTQSYRRLLEWIWKMDIDISQVVMHTKDSLWLHNLRHNANYGSDKVICLGNKSSDLLGKHGVHHYKLPHPSGLNRKLNDGKWLDKQLRECKKWLAN